MKYSEDIVEKVIDRLLSGDVSQRELERVLKIPRRTLGRWLTRRLQGQPARFKRAAKKVWNKTIQPVLDKIKALLEQGHSDVLVWLKVGKTCLRTVQRYKKQWFPSQPKPKVKVKRYERRKVFSLMHTDWGVKRIKQGVKCCFSFYEDGASRKFFDAQMNGVKHIRTRPYNPKCNDKAENIVKKAKQFLNHFEVQDLKHANQLLKQYQKEYNNTQHSSLKYHSPNQVYRDKQKKQSHKRCHVTISKELIIVNRA